MPSKKGMEQALTWLKDKAKDRSNTLDAINAELCINVIMDLQRQYDRLGSMFNNLRNANNTTDIQMKQLSFLEDDHKTRMKNTPFNEKKGAVHNEEIRRETADIRNREPNC